MNIKNILRLGYFDRLKIDGKVEPIYTSNGIQILDDLTFKESVEQSNEAYKYGLAHLKVLLIGESDTNIAFLELERMREDRQENGLVKLQSSKNVDKYIVAYADILILKSDFAIPCEIDAKGRMKKDIGKLAKTGDTLDILLASLELSKYIVNKYGCSSNTATVAIIDKIYTYPMFRRNHVSTWFHKNMVDIINMFGMAQPTALVLTYGDFAGESKYLFNMSRERYTKMLICHYKHLGYKNNSLFEFGLDSKIPKSILYKILI